MLEMAEPILSHLTSACFDDKTEGFQRAAHFLYAICITSATRRINYMLFALLPRLGGWKHCILQCFRRAVDFPGKSLGSGFSLSGETFRSPYWRWVLEGVGGFIC